MVAPMGVLLLMLVAATWADDVLDTWEGRVEAALRGPDGCWIIDWEADWDHSFARNHTRGSAALRSLFDDHRFQWHELVDADQDVLWGGEVITRPLALQVRPYLGQNRKTWVLTWASERVFLRDKVEGSDERHGWVAPGTGWDYVSTRSDGGTEVVKTAVLSGKNRRPPEDVTTAVFPLGSETPSEIERVRERHFQPSEIRWSESRAVRTYEVDGTPAGEEARYVWDGLPGSQQAVMSQAIRYRRFTPCAGVTPEPPGPDEISGVAELPQEPVSVASPGDVQSDRTPYLDAAGDDVLAAIEVLEQQARVAERGAHRAELRVWTNGGLAMVASGYLIGERRELGGTEEVLGWSAVGLASAVAVWAGLEARGLHRRAARARVEAQELR